MTAPSYRLDTIALNLIERLEGARRTWSQDPAAAERELSRIAAEQLDRILAEHDEILDTPGWSATARREVLETFLPRYIRLAVDHNALEERGYNAWRRGDPIARIIGGGAAITLAMAVARLVHHPAALVGFAIALCVPFIPEIRRFHFRRRYRAELQLVVDDMARIQGELERFPAAEAPPAAAPSPEAARVPPPRQTERPS
jgi:hypothetical protein